MTLIKCNECANEVSDKAKSCPKCGAPLVPAIKLIKCTYCTNEVSSKAKACPKCGTPTQSEQPHETPSQSSTFWKYRILWGAIIAIMVFCFRQCNHETKTISSQDQRNESIRNSPKSAPTEESGVGEGEASYQAEGANTFVLETCKKNTGKNWEIVDKAITGDFNNDAIDDYAALVKSENEIKLCIIHGNSNQVFWIDDVKLIYYLPRSGMHEVRQVGDGIMSEINNNHDYKIIFFDGTKYEISQEHKGVSGE